jgi:hypothetical protein
MIKKIVLGLLMFIVLFLVVVALQPAEYRVTCNTIVAASPPDIFLQVNDFHNWEKWSPWAKLDPGMKQTFEGPASGKGAIYRWTGDKKVGEGQMTITESHPNDLIGINLEFIKPFASIALTEFTFKPEANGKRHFGHMEHVRPQKFCLQSLLPFHEHG